MNRLIVSVLLACALSNPASAEDRPVVLIVDSSGSMWGQIEGEAKVSIARRVLGEVLGGMTPGRSVGLVAYGHRSEGDCGDIETLSSLGENEPGDLGLLLEEVKPLGKTPLAASLEHTLEALDGAPATIVLLTDGLETCEGDLCAIAAAAREAGVEITLHIVGFDLERDEVAALECAAQAGNGSYFDAADPRALAAALESAVAEPEPTDAALSVKGQRNGELLDLSISVTRNGEQIAHGRSYTSSETNPRIIPLPAGTYDVDILVVGISTEIRRKWEGLEIRGGETVERVVDLSTGTLLVGVTRNGELSDAVISVLDTTDGKRVAGGRSYTSEKSNPRRFELPAGDYEVEVDSVEISGGPEGTSQVISVPAGGEGSFHQEFSSGTLEVGTTIGEALVDCVITVRGADGHRVAGGRSYESAKSNPKRFVVEPGSYEVLVTSIKLEGKPERLLKVEIIAGETSSLAVDFSR